MTDASKRLAPDGGFTAADLPEDVAEELLELPEDFRDGFAVVEEPLPFCSMMRLMRGSHCLRALTAQGLGVQQKR